MMRKGLLMSSVTLSASCEVNPFEIATGSRLTDDTWWRDAVVYQVYVRGFAGSDGDGVGDINGVRSRLPWRTAAASAHSSATWSRPSRSSPRLGRSE